MSNVELMLSAIAHEPDDLTAACMLIDALMDERDMWRSEAEAYAEKAITAARDARDIRAAADLLRKEQPWYNELMRDILEACGLNHSVLAVVVVVPGDVKPLHAVQTHAHGAGWWTDHTITVGAVWVVHHFRNNASLCLMVPKKKPRPARSR